MRPFLLSSLLATVALLAGCGGDDEVTAAEFCERAWTSVAALVEKASPCLSDLDEQALKAELEATLPPADGCEAHVEAECAQDDRRGALALAECIDALSTCSNDTLLVFSAAVDDCLDDAKGEVSGACLEL